MLRKEQNDLLCQTGPGTPMGRMFRLSWQPALTSILPRPGAWMETLKQLTAVPLFATVIWLSWVYGSLYAPNGTDREAWLLACFLLLAIAGFSLGSHLAEAVAEEIPDRLRSSPQPATSGAPALVAANMNGWLNGLITAITLPAL